MGAPRKKLTKYTRAPFVLACVGDSLTWNYTTQVNAADFWPSQLERLLNAAGASVKARNLGASGEDTSLMVGRINAILKNGVPAVLAIMGGVNDPSTGGNTYVLASPAPTTTTFSVTGGRGQYYKANGWVDVWANGVKYTRQIDSVSTDAITLKVALPYAAYVGNTLEHNTSKNIQQIGQAAIDAGCKKVVIVSTNYRNFANNSGDQLAFPYGPNSLIRTAQQDAATTLAANNPTASVQYCDFYNYLRNLIVAGTVAQGNDLAWHVNLTDQHPNVAGNGYCAAAVRDTIVAAGWLPSLS